MNVGIIGAGLIGTKRATAVKNSRDKVVAIADIDITKAKKLSFEHSCSFATKEYQEILNNKKVNCVVIATTHNFLSEITYKALKKGKHVLVEKPLGLNTKEINKCVNLAKKKGLVYKAGYNHRFHPAILKARQFAEKGKIGNLMYIRAVYGHGGRPGYEKEWRTNKKISGGGELIDQGAHLIDLALWFLGKNLEIQSILTTSFWPITPVEDNVFLIMNNSGGVAFLHASWTEWKNLFLFEIYGEKGFLKINGLGGSYGNETLTFGIRVPGKAPKEKGWVFEGEDISWKNEWINFRNAVLSEKKIIGSGKDGLMTMKVIEKIYR